MKFCQSNVGCDGGTISVLSLAMATLLPLLVAILFVSSQVSGIPSISTIKHCCELGTNFAESGLKCSSFQMPIAGISKQDEPYCLNRVTVCCNNKYLDKQCNFGKSVASSGESCTSSLLDDQYSQGCCETCKLGLDASASGQDCGESLELGPPFDETYTQCCKESTKFSTTTTTRRSTTSKATTTSSKPVETTTPLSTTKPDKPMVLVEVCDMCAQLCHPYESSNRCDCYPGYSLMKDGVSCKPNKRPTRCPKNNPCEQDCIDTGTSIQCLCKPGYKLADDNKSCLDIDECELGTHKCAPDEICINYEGDYDCENPNEIDDDNEDMPEEKKCPDGYKFFADEDLCKDIDECEFPLICARPKVCVNTIGSYHCEGDDLPPCPPGFFYKESILDCADIDECVTGDNDCNRESQTCLNTKGNYTCIDKASKKTCPPGFKKNTLTDNCEDINECEETPDICKENEECINESGGHSCLPKLPIPTLPSTAGTTLSTKPSTTSTTISTTPVPTTLNTKTTTPPTTTKSLPPLVFLPPSTTTLLPLYTPPTESKPESTTPITVSTVKESPTIASPMTPPPYRPPFAFSTPHVRFPVNYPNNNQPVSCSRGYRYSTQHGNCIDIDECLEEEPCDSNQDCYNQQGSYVCNCKVGFKKDFHTGACVDINECQIHTHDCSEGQRCDNTIGSYLCSRTAGCGTGYTLNYANGECEDDDECVLGTHTCGDLGPRFQCRNTKGSYRCDLKPVTNINFKPAPPISKPTLPPPPPISKPPKFPVIVSQMKCLPGYYMNEEGQCKDIDECQSNPCPRGQKCLNLNGRFECIPTIICTNGYELNEEGNDCVDIDECAKGTHKCGQTKICKNAPGYYICQCPPGHHLDLNRECVDIDECLHYRGRICSTNGECVNTIGSYQCNCKNGFRGNGTYCEDINECAEQPNMCEQRCVNLYGSYRCSCERGYTLNPDNRTCSDIDECEKFKNELMCIGNCNNVPGSFTCSCPEGYRVGADGRTCQDIDECQQNPCKNPDEICFNMRGTYRCPSIKCPDGYVKDRHLKSRCTKSSHTCDRHDFSCLEMPRFYSFHFFTLVSKYTIQGKLDFFQTKGPANAETQVTYQLVLINSKCPFNVRRVDDTYFTTTLYKKNILVSIVKPIEGPQEIELQLISTFFVNGTFHAKALSRIFIFVSAYPF